MTVSTFNPDANPEDTSVDGAIEAQTGSDQTWTNIRGTAEGDGAFPTSSNISVARVVAGSTTNQYATLVRGFFLFDTSGLPDGDTVSAATFELYVKAITDDLGATSVALVLCNPAADDNLVVADFNNFTFTEQATAKAIASMSLDTYEVWTLNSTGLGNISKTGISKFGTVITYDLSNGTEPVWSSLAQCNFRVLTAETANDPKLVVTHATLFKPKVMMF